MLNEKRSSNFVEIKFWQCWAPACTAPQSMMILLQQERITELKCALEKLNSAAPCYVRATSCSPEF